MSDANNLLNEIGLPLQTLWMFDHTRWHVVRATPGAYFESLPEGQKAVLRGLRSDDLDVRPDLLCPAPQGEWEAAKKKLREDGR